MILELTPDELLTTTPLVRKRLDLVKPADLLEIPYDDVTQAGLFPVASTIGLEFRPADRSASQVRWNRW